MENKDAADLEDLKEMQDRLKKYQDSRDITQLEMVFKILEDWVDELTNKSK